MFPRARTDYDNVIVTIPSRKRCCTADTFSQTFLERQRPWTSAPANAWSIVQYTSGEQCVSANSLLSGTPRAVNGGPDGRPDRSSNRAAARVSTRRQRLRRRDGAALYDDSNHYYVALYRGKAALRKR
jgi:hypothetical protein